MEDGEGEGRREEMTAGEEGERTVAGIETGESGEDEDEAE